MSSQHDRVYEIIRNLLLFRLEVYKEYIEKKRKVDSIITKIGKDMFVLGKLSEDSIGLMKSLDIYDQIIDFSIITKTSIFEYAGDIIPNKHIERLYTSLDKIRAILGFGPTRLQASFWTDYEDLSTKVKMEYSRVNTIIYSHILQKLGATLSIENIENKGFPNIYFMLNSFGMEFPTKLELYNYDIYDSFVGRHSYRDSPIWMNRMKRILNNDISNAIKAGFLTEEDSVILEQYDFGGLIAKTMAKNISEKGECNIYYCMNFFLLSERVTVPIVSYYDIFFFDDRAHLVRELPKEDLYLLQKVMCPSAWYDFKILKIGIHAINKHNDCFRGCPELLHIIASYFIGNPLVSDGIYYDEITCHSESYQEPKPRPMNNYNKYGYRKQTAQCDEDINIMQPYDTPYQELVFNTPQPKTIQMLLNVFYEYISFREMTDPCLVSYLSPESDYEPTGVYINNTVQNNKNEDNEQDNEEDRNTEDLYYEKKLSGRNKYKRDVESKRKLRARRMN